MTLRLPENERFIPLGTIQTDARFADREWLTISWTPGFRSTKRAFDIVICLLIGILSLPVLPIIAILIRLDSLGGVMYTQGRIGYQGRRFYILKFRTMRHDAEANGAAYASEDDPRVTRIGRVLRKTRLDELPQMWNVIKGDMSLIGPRPERPENEHMLEDAIPGFSLRTAVRPGLTGWAQVCAPYANTVEQSSRKLEYDLYYIRNASIALDLRILWRTAAVMLRFAGQ